MLGQQPSESWQQRVGGAAFSEAANQLTIDLVKWIATQPLSELISRSDVETWLGEDMGSFGPEGPFHLAFERLWAEAEGLLSRDSRTIGQTLGPKLSADLVAVVEAFEPNEKLVRSLFEQGAVEAMLSSVIYDQIMAFIDKADLLGPIVDKLPILGGIRRRLLDTFRTEFRGRAEAQVRTFLASGARVAVHSAISYVLSPNNRQRFKKLRGFAVGQLLETPLKKLVLAPEDSARLRKAVWGRISTWLEDEAAWPKRLDWLDAHVGSRNLEELRERFAVPDWYERLGGVGARGWVRFLLHPQSEAWFAQHLLNSPVRRPA